MSYTDHFNIIEQKDNGNCFFHCVAYHLHNESNLGAPIRSAVISWYKFHPEGIAFLQEKSQFLKLHRETEVRPIDQYISEMTKDTIYAGTVEMLAVEKMIALQVLGFPFGTKIYFYHDGHKNYQDLAANVIPVDTVKNGSNIRMYFKNGNHYNVLEVIEAKEQEEQAEEDAGSAEPESNSENSKDAVVFHEAPKGKPVVFHTIKKKDTQASQAEDPSVSQANSSLDVAVAIPPCPLSEKSSDKITKTPTQTLIVTCQHGRQGTKDHVEFSRIKEFHVVPDVKVEKGKYIDKVKVEWVEGENPEDPKIRGLKREGSGKKYTYSVAIDAPVIAAEQGWSDLSESHFIFNPVKRLAELFKAMKAPFSDTRIYTIPEFSPRHAIHIHNPDKWELLIIGNFLPAPHHITFGYSHSHKEGYGGGAETEMTQEHLKNDSQLEWKTDNDGQVLGQNAFTPGPPDPLKPKIELFQGNINQMKEPNKWVQVSRNGKQIKVPLLATLTNLYNLVNGLYSAIKFVSQGSPNWWYFTGSIRVLKGKIGVGWQNMEIEAPDHQHMAAFVFDMAYQMEVFYAKIEFGIGPDLVLFKAQIYISIDGGLDINAGLRDAIYFDGKTNRLSLFADFKGHIEGEIGVRVEVKFIFKLEPKMLTGLNMPGEIGVKKGQFGISGDIEFTGIKAEIEFSFGLHMAIKRLATVLGFRESGENVGKPELKKQLIKEFQRPPIYSQAVDPLHFYKGTGAPSHVELKNRKLCAKLSSMWHALSRMLNGERYVTTKPKWRKEDVHKIEFYKYQIEPDKWEYIPRDFISHEEAVNRIITLGEIDESIELSAEQYAKFASAIGDHLRHTEIREDSHKKRDFLFESYLEDSNFRAVIQAKYQEHCQARTEFIIQHDHIAELFLKELDGLKGTFGKRVIDLSTKNCESLAIEIGKSIVEEEVDGSEPRFTYRDNLDFTFEREHGGQGIYAPIFYEKFVLKKDEAEQAKEDRYSGYFGDYRKEKGIKKLGCFLAGGEYKNDWTIIRAKKLATYRWPNFHYDEDAGEKDEVQEEWEYELKKKLVRKLARYHNFWAKARYCGFGESSGIPLDLPMLNESKIYFFSKDDNEVADPTEKDIKNRETALSVESLREGLISMLNGEGFKEENGLYKQIATVKRKPFEFYHSLKFTSKKTYYIPHIENGRPRFGDQIKNKFWKHIPEDRGMKSIQVADILLMQRGEGYESLPAEAYVEILMQFRTYLMRELDEKHPVVDNPSLLNYKATLARYYVKVDYLGFIIDGASVAGKWGDMLSLIYDRVKREFDRKSMTLLTNGAVASRIIDKIKTIENGTPILLRSDYEYNDMGDGLLDILMPDSGEPLFKDRLHIDAITEMSELTDKITKPFLEKYAGHDKSKLHEVIVDMLNNSKGDPEPGGNWRKRFFVNYVLFDTIQNQHQENAWNTKFKLGGKNKLKPDTDSIDGQWDSSQSEATSDTVEGERILRNVETFASALLADIGHDLKIKDSDRFLDNTYEGFEGIAYAIRYEILEKIRFSGKKDEQIKDSFWTRIKPIKRPNISVFINNDELEKKKDLLLRIFNKSNNAFEAYKEAIKKKVEETDESDYEVEL